TFRRGQLDYDADILCYQSGTVGGMLQTLKKKNAEIHPLLVASACPSRHITQACYQQLKDELLTRLNKALPVQGVLLALHGAAAAEDVGDIEGDLLQSVRSLVGSGSPIVATLDLHAHVTGKMVQAADALLAWETYPHADAWETGVRGAQAMLDILDGKLRPTMTMAKAPVLVSGIRGNTAGSGPFADVMRMAKSYEQEQNVYSTSAFLVHPYLDLPGMGGGGLVITNNDPARSEELARTLAIHYWQQRFELEPPVISPAAAIQNGLKIDGGPVLLVETADCCGGGAAGDSVCTLKALLELAAEETALVPVVDPLAAAACGQAGEGKQVTVELGHQLDPTWGKPVTVTGQVLSLSAGQFQYRGGIWDGTKGQMGPTAVVQVGGIRILITSFATYEWCGEQFEALGLEAASSKFVVAKNPMNYGMAYGEFAQATFILDTPGPTPATLKHVAYKHLQRPYFPADEEITDWQPTILRSELRQLSTGND
ncbi:MAG: M81 family metallopeptidase, partial [Pirellulaceae bacterium]